MIAHPSITKLRGNRIAQHRARNRVQIAVAQWQESALATVLCDALERYSGGELLEDCPALFRTLHDVSAARILIDAWQATFASALQDEPLAQMPFRHRIRGSIATIQLLAQGNATLSLCAIPRGAELTGQDTIVFGARETCELIVKGSATGTAHRLCDDSQSAILQNSDAAWQAGDTIENTPTQARSILHIEHNLLIIQVSRAPLRPRAAREFNLTDGQYLRSASGDEQVSRKYMALGVLGAMGRTGAADEMGDVARNVSLDRDLRWEAVRQLLALAPEAGMRLLGELRARASDPLCKPAEHLTAQLAANHPELTLFIKEAA